MAETPILRGTPKPIKDAVAGDEVFFETPEYDVEIDADGHKRVKKYRAIRHVETLNGNELTAQITAAERELDRLIALQEEYEEHEDDED